MLIYELTLPNINTKIFDIIEEKNEKYFEYIKPKYFPNFIYKHFKKNFKKPFILKWQLVNQKQQTVHNWQIYSKE